MTTPERDAVDLARLQLQTISALIESISASTADPQTVLCLDAVEKIADQTIEHMKTLTK